MYDFKEQLNDQRQKNGLIAVKNYFLSLGEEIIDVSENSDYFKKGIDLIKKFPDSEWYIDVKTDLLAHQTGNIPIELVEVCGIDGYFKAGWLYSDIHEIIYYIYETKEMYKFKITDLKSIVFGKVYKGYASPHKNYYTLGILLPLNELQHYKIIF